MGVRRNIANDRPVIGPYGVNEEGSGDMHLMVQDETATHAEYDLVRQMRGSVPAAARPATR